MPYKKNKPHPKHKHRWHKHHAPTPDTTSDTMLTTTCEIGLNIVSGFKNFISTRLGSSVPKMPVVNEIRGQTNMVKTMLVSAVLLDPMSALEELPKQDASLFLTRFTYGFLAYNSAPSSALKNAGASLLRDHDITSWTDWMYGPDGFKKWLGSILSNCAPIFTTGTNFLLGCLVSYIVKNTVFSFLNFEDDTNPVSWEATLLASGITASLEGIGREIIKYVEGNYIQFYVASKITEHLEQFREKLQDKSEQEQISYIEKEIKKLGKTLSSAQIEQLTIAIREALLAEETIEKDISDIPSPSFS